MALAADTVNTVKGMRALLDAGIDALSLVAQLASLITNILAGTFDLRRETRKKGFFSRNMRKFYQELISSCCSVNATCCHGLVAHEILHVVLKFVFVCTSEAGGAATLAAGAESACRM